MSTDFLLESISLSIVLQNSIITKEEENKEKEVNFKPYCQLNQKNHYLKLYYSIFKQNTRSLMKFDRTLL